MTILRIDSPIANQNLAAVADELARRGAAAIFTEEALDNAPEDLKTFLLELNRMTLEAKVQAEKLRIEIREEAWR